MRERNAAKVSEYAEAISNGDMTIEEALEKVIEREQQEKQARDAEADARSTWFKKLAELVDWVERFVQQRDDEHLAWYVLPNSPGLDKHGLTAARIAQAINQLDRVRTITFGGHSNGASQRSTRNRRT